MAENRLSCSLFKQPAEQWSRKPPKGLPLLIGGRAECCLSCTLNWGLGDSELGWVGARKGRAKVSPPTPPASGQHKLQISKQHLNASGDRYSGSGRVKLVGIGIPLFISVPKNINAPITAGNLPEGWG